MRDILFRGRVKGSLLGIKDMDWVFGHYVKELSTGRTFIADIGKLSDNTTASSILIEVSPETVGQFTGLTDKNGMKIFEGDIVRCLFNTKEWNAIVEEDDCNPCFVLRNTQNRSDLEYDFLKCFIMKLEVIGNIYDNPELLEVDYEN